jgi:CheY-like chemotaxis protein
MNGPSTATKSQDSPREDRFDARLHALSNTLQDIVGSAECARAALPLAHPAQAFMMKILAATQRAKHLLSGGVAAVNRPVQFQMASRRRSPQSRHILVVDDEIEVGLQTSRMFQELGYDVSTFQDPEAALKLLAADPAAVDLIVTDFCMPHLSGAVLIERARALRRDLPVVMTTGFSDALESEHPQLTSTCQVLRKPFDSATLAQTVRGLLSGAKRQMRVA